MNRPQSPSRQVKAPKLSARERDWQAVQNAPTDYAESVLSRAYHERWSARPAVKASAKPVKARKVWAAFCPSYVLPADAAAYDQLVNQITIVIPHRTWMDCAENDHSAPDRKTAYAILAAIGITRPTS